MAKLLRILFRLDIAASILIALALLVVSFAPGHGMPVWRWTGPPAGWQTYRDATLGFAISYPKGWKVDRNSDYVGFGPDHNISGVAFRIPAAITTGTNLSPNLTAVGVDSVTGPGRCDAKRLLADPRDIHTLTDNGIRYSTATASDAGAGNLYDIVIYAVVGSRPCLGVRYFIHSTNIGNYDPGTIKPFDRAKLLALFDSIRRTLVLHPK